VTGCVRGALRSAGPPLNRRLGWADSVEMERPRHRVSALRIVGVATGLGIFSSLTAYNYVSLFTSGDRPFYFLLALNVTYWYAWALLVPGMLWMARRYRFERATWRRAAAMHCLAVPAFIFTHAMLTISSRMLITEALGGGVALIGRPVEFWPSFRELFFLNFDWEMMTYWAVVGLSHALDFHRESQERELTAAHLESPGTPEPAAPAFPVQHAAHHFGADASRYRRG
jgi:hypothetical protein